MQSEGPDVMPDAVATPEVKVTVAG